MAFSGYPDGHKALSELARVLRPNGRLVIIDVNYPADANRLGTALVELWKRSGDLIRDMHALFTERASTRSTARSAGSAAFTSTSPKAGEQARHALHARK